MKSMTRTLRVAQTQLPRRLFGSLELVRKASPRYPPPASRAPNSRRPTQGFGMVDHHCTPRLQIDLAGSRPINLVFDLEAENSGTSSR